MAMFLRRVPVLLGLAAMLCIAMSANAEFRHTSAILERTAGAGPAGFEGSLLAPDGTVIDGFALSSGTYLIHARAELDYKFHDEGDSGSSTESTAFQILFVDPGRINILSVESKTTSLAVCDGQGESNTTTSMALSGSLSEPSSENRKGCSAFGLANANWASSNLGITLRQDSLVSLNTGGIQGNASAQNDFKIRFAVSGAPGELTDVDTDSIAPADLNADGCVDTADLGILIAQFGTAGPEADINGDGVVDTADLGQLIGEFGTMCP